MTVERVVELKKETVMIHYRPGHLLLREQKHDCVVLKSHRKIYFTI